MSCAHKHSVSLMRRRVTLVPNTMRGRMLTRECAMCGELLAVNWPTLVGANDRGIGNEIRAAALYAEVQDAR